MELRDHLRTLGKRWALVALCGVLGLAAAGAALFVITPTYQARTQVFVSVRTDPTNLSSAFQGTSFTEQRVKSYAALIDSPRVLQPVINAQRLGVTPQQLAGSVSATVPLDTNLIDISVDDASPQQAADLANAVSIQFAEYVRQIEQTDSNGDSLVKVSVVRPAEVPTSPVSPKTTLLLALGLLVGLAAGVALAILREGFDTTVKTEDDLDGIGQALGRPLPVLGAIAKDSDAPKRPLIVHSDPRSTRAEAFRQLRTNLQFVDVDNPPRSIVITSSLPEEGKSTTAGNLAITLAQAGLRVALVEADLRRPRLAGYMGLEGAAGLTDVLVGRAKVDQVMQPWGTLPLSVLPSGPAAPNPSELLGSHTMLMLIHELESTHDIVLLDAPPLLPVTDAAVMSALAGGALLVVRSGRTKKDQVGEAVEALQAVDARLLGVVMSMVPSRGRTSTYDYGYAYTADTGRKKGKVSRVRQRTAPAPVPAPTPLTPGDNAPQTVVPTGRGRRGRRS